MIRIGGNSAGPALIRMLDGVTEREAHREGGLRVDEHEEGVWLDRRRPRVNPASSRCCSGYRLRLVSHSRCMATVRADPPPLPGPPAAQAQRRHRGGSPVATRPTAAASRIPIPGADRTCVLATPTMRALGRTARRRRPPSRPRPHEANEPALEGWVDESSAPAREASGRPSRCGSRQGHGGVEQLSEGGYDRRGEVENELLCEAQPHAPGRGVETEGRSWYCPPEDCKNPTPIVRVIARTIPSQRKAKTQKRRLRPGPAHPGGRGRREVTAAPPRPPRAVTKATALPARGEDGSRGRTTPRRARSREGCRRSLPRTRKQHHVKARVVSGIQVRQNVPARNHRAGGPGARRRHNRNTIRRPAQATGRRSRRSRGGCSETDGRQAANQRTAGAE